MSTLKTINVIHPSGSTTNIVNDSSGNVTVGNNLTVTGTSTLTGNITASGGITASGTVSMGSSFLRNRIINGAMQIWQRGTSNTAINNNPTYLADRWYGFVSAVTTGEQILQSSSVPTGLFQYSAAFGRPNGNTNTNSIWFCQNIESVNIYDLSSQTVTLSFYAKTGANYSGGAMTVRLATGTTADQSSATFSAGPATGFTGYAAPIGTTQSLTTTWTRYSFTGTLGSGVLEAAVAFAFTPTGTAGADDNIYITGVQLEAGSVATPFERRQYGQELLLCQRYAIELGKSTDNNQAIGMGYIYNTTQGTMTLMLPATMRTVPSLTYVGTLTAANLSINLTSLTVDTFYNSLVQFSPTLISGGTAQSYLFIRYANQSTRQFLLSAEL
jgi:hypothetical protein